jgi:outer membrane receptor protein involved in Fe transport
MMGPTPRAFVLAMSMVCAVGVGAWAQGDGAGPPGPVDTPTPTPAPEPEPAPALTDEELLALAESEAMGETIEIWDERPEKPFDRDTEVRLTGEELAKRGATDLATALALIPEVTVRDAGRGGFNIDIRGARKGAVRVIIDGVAVSDPFYGTFDVSTIPVTDIVEIRVSTAPASPIDGPGGPGGVIEVHTRDAVGEQLVVARVTSDTMPTFGASATGRVALSPHLALRLSASGLFGVHDYETATEATARDRRRASTGAFRLEYRKRGRRAVIDGFVDDRRYLSPPSDELATAAFLLIDRETTGRIGVGFDDDVGADKKLQIQARAWAHAIKRVSRYFADPELAVEGSSEDLFAMRIGGSALATRPIGKRARWVAAVTVDHERARVEADSGAMVMVTKGDATVLEGAAGGQYERGPVEVDAAAGVAVPLGVDADPWPEGKLTIKLAQRYGEVALVGARKGRVPSLRERYQGMGSNVSLDPEQAWHGEVRLTARPRDGIEVVVAPFYRHTTGTVKLGPDSMLVNLGELDIKGVDASAKAQILAQLAVGGSYDYAKATSADLGPDPVDRFPTHKADGWVRVTPRPRYSVLARARYVGRAIDGARQTPAYVMWEASATAQLGGDWLAVVRCDDILDEAPETRNGFHMPGRVLTVIVQGTWD